jgi:WD40 repeat protein
MGTTASSFYVTGGTLRSDAPSYVERRADTDLYEGLSRGEFCYVLTARQMGKSSLMVRTAARLRQEGVAVVVLDLITIGQNLSPEQWYDGLQLLMGQQLHLEDEMEEFWQEHERLGPLQRWMAALREVVLARVSGRIVLFVDEIDTVRSLPFSTDEFFAGIRSCYNRRTEDPAFARLTFCLLGVASPADLIRDTRLTPFNIGQRIELTDFGETEAASLTQGLGRKGKQGAALLERVLFWTGGHPYLTQRLCQAVANNEGVMDSGGVDRLCEELFLTPRAREQDDNLLFVRERLLRGEADRASLLELYRQVWHGKRVPDDETNPLVSLLRLSGIVRRVERRLQVRNRIYARVFDREWVQANMPDAELRRQRAAYRKALLRTTAVAGLILAAVGAMALSAVRSDSQARRAAVEARGERDRATRLLYAAQVNLAQRAWEDGNLLTAIELLNAQRPGPGRENLRGFEWRYLWGLCRGDARLTLRGPTETVTCVSLSPDGRTLASASVDGTVTLWDLARRQVVATLRGHRRGVGFIQFSPDGRTLASAYDSDGIVKLWDVGSRRERTTLRSPKGVKVAFSPDGEILATVTWDGPVRLWKLTSRREVATLPGTECVAFSPDGKTLASCVSRGVGLWDVATRRRIAFLPGHGAWVETMAFSPDGRTLASGSGDRTVKLWEVATHHERATLTGHRAPVLSVAFSPDSRTLVTGSIDGTLKLWDVATARERTTLRGHRGPVTSATFSADGRSVISGSSDRTIKLWAIDTQQAGVAGPMILKNRDEVYDLAFSPDGRTLALASLGGLVRLWDVPRRRPTGDLRGPNLEKFVAFSPDGRALATGGDGATIQLWDLATRRVANILRGNTGSVFSAAFAPDGRTLATASGDRTVKLWDLGTKQPRLTLRGHSEPVSAVAFSPDGQTLASGSWDGTVRLWDVATGRTKVIFRGHTENVPTVAFSHDGRLLASGSLDNTVKLWGVGRQPSTPGVGAAAAHATSGSVATPLATLKGHAAGVWRVAFSADDKTLASGSQDGTVKLWNVSSQQAVATLPGHAGPVQGLAFSPDGDTLASGSEDGTVRLWRAASFAETDAPAGTRSSSR